MKILTDNVTCTGCRACELACSFHHKGFFAPELSSIKVTRDNQNGEIFIVRDATCDFCNGEKGPMCVEFCTFGALKEIG